MATMPAKLRKKEVIYPDSDGKPVAETEVHRDNLLFGIEMLRWHFESDPDFYVTGNMFLYYVKGDKRRHVSPDIFVIRGIPKLPKRRYFLLWEEKKGPDFITELTSKSTRHEDLETKFHIYQDILKVREYFLCDPFGEYLHPPLQGFRLHRGKYQPIRPVKGRLPSEVLGLHLEKIGFDLRFYDPVADELLIGPEQAREQAGAAKRAIAAQKQAEAEVERLRHELEALRKSSPNT